MRRKKKAKRIKVESISCLTLKAISDIIIICIDWKRFDPNIVVSGSSEQR